MKPLRVLLIEDSDKDTALLLRQLRSGGYDPSFERVETLEAMVSAISTRAWDILISDHSMPHFSAMEALKALKDRNLDIPVIILSGTIQEENAVEAMRSGASDYIMKGNTARLLPAIERELREAQLRRKARLTEEQFLQAQKMEAIGRLAGGVAHEFNNLLTAIGGYSAFVLANMRAGDPNRADVEEIKKAGERAAVLTRQLLSFSRQQVLQPKVLDLNRIVADVERMMRRVIGEDIVWDARAAADLGPIRADAGQLEQVLMNLVINARDAMPKGGRLTIETANLELGEDYARAHPEVRPGAYVKLSVSDTGCGIAPDVLPHIFEPFFTTKETGKGTGLGLSTVFGIVQQSRGSIAVSSELGRGASVTIYLPRVAGAPEAEAPARRHVRPSRGSETLLLVEDDEIVRKFIVRVLSQQGYTVLAAGGAGEALRACEAQAAPIPLVICDVVMPGMRGGELSRKISESRPGIKVILISGYSEYGMIQEDLMRPGIHFIQKPIKADALARKVREVLDESLGAPS